MDEMMRRTIPSEAQYASLVPFLCRCCLSGDAPLYKMNRDVCSLFTELTRIANFSNPHLNLICGCCLHFLRRMSRFLTQCYQANTRFHKLLIWNNMNPDKIQNIDRSGMNTLASSKIELISYTPHCPSALDNLEITEIIHLDIPAYVEIDIPNVGLNVSTQKPVQANLSTHPNNLMDIESKIPRNLIFPLEESVSFRSEAREKSEAKTYLDQDLSAHRYNPLVHNELENEFPKTIFTIPLETVTSRTFTSHIPNRNNDTHINELKSKMEKEQMQKRNKEMKERLIQFVDGEGDKKNMEANEEICLDTNKRAPKPNIDLDINKSVHKPNTDVYTHITDIGTEWSKQQMGRKKTEILNNSKHVENKIADKETNKKSQPSEEINVTYSEIINGHCDLNVNDNEVLNQDQILAEEEQLETKDDVIIKEENLIHIVDDDENTQPSGKEKNIYDDLNFKIFDDIDPKDTVSPDNEILSEEEEFESKDDIIIKEENLIHVVDDDDETVEPNVEPIKNHTENTKKKYSRRNRVLPQSIEVDSSSSSSSSGSSASSSSSSSSSDDEVEIQEVPPAEIDLTAEDDDNNRPPENNLDNTKDVSTDDIKDPTTPVVIQNINPPTPVVNTKPKQNAVYVNKKKFVFVDDKMNAQNKELNIEEFDTPVENNTVRDPLEENNEIIVQPVTSVATGDDNATTKNTGDTVTKSNVQTEDMCSSESGDDLPDCLFGFNSDIYKKDTKRAFAKNETEQLPANNKIRFVDQIEVNADHGRYTTKSVDEICKAKELKKTKEIEVNKKRPMTEFEIVRRRFEAKRKKQEFSIMQRYVKGRIIKSFVVPRK